MGTEAIFWAMIVVVFVAIPAAPFMYHFVKNRMAMREMERAAAGTCLLCDSSEIDERAPGEYECLECGFDSSWKDDDELGPLFHQLRMLREAERSFEAAADLMKSAHRWSWFDILSGTGNMKRDRMQKAGKAQVSGLSDLNEVVSEYPELLEMPVAGETVTSSALADVGLDFIGTDVKVHRQIEKSRDQVERYLDGVTTVKSGLVSRIYKRCDADPPARR